MASYFKCNLTDEEAAEAFREFDGWLDQDELRQVDALFDQYLFYESMGRRGFRDCCCTACGGFEVYRDDDPDFFDRHHSELVECPNCGYDVQLVSLGKMRSMNSLRQKRHITICRAGESGALLLLSGNVYKDYRDFDLNPSPEFEETRRTWLAPGKRMQWVPRMEWRNGVARQVGWRRETSVREPFQPNMNLTYDGSYYLIMPDQIEITDLRYCQIADYYFHWFGQSLHEPECGADATRHTVQYLAAYTALPSMEITVRIDFGEAVQELVELGRKNADVLNWAGRNPAEFLRLSKPDAKALIAHGVNLAALRFYKAERKAGRVRNMAEFLSIAEAVGGVANLPMLDEIVTEVGCTLAQAAKYLQERADGTARRALIIWRDYLRFARQLGYDLTRMDVRMPKNLLERHDAAAATIQHEEDAKALESYSKRYSALRKMYEFSYGGYSIIVPAAGSDIVSEGKTLHHCVGGYAAQHLTGKVDILFFRKTRKAGRSLVTIEMAPRSSATDLVSIRQAHGYRNDLYKGAVRPLNRYAWFFEVWLEWLQHGSKRDAAGNPILPKKKGESA